MSALKMSPQYVARLRAASPALRRADPGELIALRSVGASPEYILELANSGFANLDADALTEARAVGVTGSYAKSIREAGVAADLDGLVEMRAVGVTARFIQRLKAAGHNVRDPDRVIELYVVGAEHSGRAIPRPASPIPPKPTTRHPFPTKTAADTRRNSRRLNTIDLLQRPFADVRPPLA